MRESFTRFVLGGSRKNVSLISFSFAGICLLFAAFSVVSLWAAEGKPIAAGETSVSVEAVKDDGGEQDKITIDSDFPGGNIRVDSIEGDLVRVRPDLRGGSSWFYFAFRVKNAQGHTLRFLFDAKNRIGARGPAVSLDEGKNWRYLSQEANADSREFTYAFGPEDRSVIFALAPLYTRKNWDEFMAKYQGRGDVELSALCQSPKRRNVELLRIGKGNPGARFAVVLTCRHHACEMTASWVLEGMLEEVLDEKSEFGAYLRENAEFFVVPFMDKDGVEDGDQGKGRKPHDHNRDYNHELYPEIRALKSQVAENFSPESGKKIFFMDMHCPWIRSGKHEMFFSMLPKESWISEAANNYLGAFEKYQNEGEIPYALSHNIPFGKGGNTMASFAKLENGIPTASAKIWACGLSNILCSCTVEIPYSNSSGVEVMPRNARELGRNLSKALADFLENAESAE